MKHKEVKMADGRTGKRCSHCGKVKPLEDYYVRKDGSLYAMCKQCHCEYGRNYRKRYKERIRRERKLQGIREIVKRGKDGRMHVFRSGGGKPSGRPPIYWSGAMIEDLRRLYPTTTGDDLAVWLRIPKRTVQRKAHELGLKKNKAWLSRLISETRKRICLEMKYFGKFNRSKKD